MTMDPNDNKEVKKPMTDEERIALAKKLDDELDEFINGLEKKRYTDGWSEDKWEEEMDKHPFFMKTVPEEGEMSPLVEGLAKLKYDPEENTPLELATSYKEDGNFHFKHKNYRMAIIAYTEGIKQKCNNDDLNATLYQNRASAHFHLKNFRSALIDSERSLKFAPEYFKAQFRAAKSAFQCSKYSQCIDYCQKILQAKQDNEVTDMLTKAKQKLIMQERDERRKKRLNATQSERQGLIVRTVKERGIRVFEWVEKKDELDAELEYILLKPTSLNSDIPNDMVHLVDGILHWPVLLIYPEYKITDYIKECPESNTLLGNILNQVFPAPWDEENKYSISSINVYYEGYNLKLQKVDPMRKLSELMVERFFHVKGGLASFIILAKGSEAEKSFLKDYDVYD